MEDHKNESLPELIARMQITIILPYLEKSYLRKVFPLKQNRKEILAEICLTGTLPEAEQIRRTALNVMADIIIDFWLKKYGKNIKKHKAVKEFVSDNPTLYDEIVAIYDAIKKQVGFSGYLGEREEALWQEAALKRFDDNPVEFKIIKRNYLESDSLYRLLRDGQERRNFENLLGKTILEDKLGIKIGAFVEGGVRKILKD
jgi:hypothetical protein